MLSKRAYFTCWYDKAYKEIFIVGGNNKTDTAMSSCERFNIITRTTRTVSPLLTARTTHAMCEVNIKGIRFLYVLGGRDIQTNAMNSIEIINLDD